ncbi:hypothetical protein AbraIFM66951_002860 [Aspergillus brasiliensis]|uniref:YCII-related domain-containing protein n=2 Tax=Aspergillus brasiliensis TaxID=319629 RepID=A0A1L9V1F8_ASPBC|nr:hypothetical protein ASPBRDRAFT_113618 [Aspergillus brasiliensis CBS 101740]GKZ19585.1 hypothetical protein AbraCBS73388_004396 [Aspergillus brasiliensis]GKZ50013.1 hypothetical protein AbraIFM66951_002860 [Aspergillus brasiliensis]
MSFLRLSTRALPAHLLPRQHIARRTIATASKKEWLCIIPDTPSGPELRKKFRPTHMEGVGPLVQAGKLVAGGAMLATHPEEGKDLAFKGSMLVYTAETMGEVHELITSDIYAKSGVWDLGKALVVPYLSAVREPLKKE